MTIHELSNKISEISREKGFGDNKKDINVGEKIALIHSQISSAYEGYRNKKMKGRWSFENEIAGAIQRIFHLCGILEVDIEKALEKKLDEIKKRKWNWDKLNEKHV
jgi:hypothetical protein